MAEKTSSEQIESTAVVKQDDEFHEEGDETPSHIHLTWKTWMVVFISCFAIMAQVIQSIRIIEEPLVSAPLNILPNINR